MVYVLHSKATNAVKIGWTRDIKSRQKSHQISNPEPLRLIATIEGERSKEKELHRKFAHLRIQGEWFSCSLELLIAIDEMTGSKLAEETFHLGEDIPRPFVIDDGDMPSF